MSLKKSIFALFLLLATTAFAGEDWNSLQPLFGNYRTKSYNGVENVYSGRFFSPTINVEPSVKLRRIDDTAFNTFNLNLEVPIVTGPDSIFMKFIFLEAPLDGASIETKDKVTTLFFEGDIQERVNEEWHSCKAKYILKFTELTEQLSSVDFKRETALPCENFQHEILLERVKF